MTSCISGIASAPFLSAAKVTGVDVAMPKLLLCNRGFLGIYNGSPITLLNSRPGTPQLASSRIAFGAVVTNILATS